MTGERTRIVIVEDAAELRLQQPYAGCLDALRMRPDRIIIREMRDSEAFDMLLAGQGKSILRPATPEELETAGYSEMAQALRSGAISEAVIYPGGEVGVVPATWTQPEEPDDGK